MITLFTRNVMNPMRLGLIIAVCLCATHGRATELPNAFSALVKKPAVEYKRAIAVPAHEIRGIQVMSVDEIATPCEFTCSDGGPDCDGDTICDDVDNCGSDANSGQEDTDGDGDGDACDLDDDDDGVSDEDDDEPLNPYVCQDLDDDGCDDCSQWDFTFTPDTDNDGEDYDYDGNCDYTDEDDDNDGVQDMNDSEPHSSEI